MVYKKAPVFIFLIVLFSLNSLSAYLVYDSYQETADIISKDNVHETIEIFFDFEQSQDSINFFLVPGISNLKVFLDEKQLEECKINSMIGKTNIICALENSISGKHFLKAEFDSSYPLIKINNRLMFRSNYEPVFETKNFLFVLKLPKGYVIPEEPDKDKSFFISPEEEIIYSDGQRIILRWEKKDLDERFDVSVISELLKKRYDNLVFPLILAVALILFLIIYFSKSRKKQREIPKKKKVVKKSKKELKEKIIEEHLMDNEKAIINELRNADKKELWQKQLQLKTEFSKAKLSRVIRNLEARNIIQKIPFGNTNKIKLKIN